MTNKSNGLTLTQWSHRVGHAVVGQRTNTAGVIRKHRVVRECRIHAVHQVAACLLFGLFLRLQYILTTGVVYQGELCSFVVWRGMNEGRGFNLMMLIMFNLKSLTKTKTGYDWSDMANR